MANVKKTRQRFKWKHVTWHFLSRPKAIEPRDQLRPGSFLHPREDAGNEVVKMLRFLAKRSFIRLVQPRVRKYFLSNILFNKNAI